MPGNIQNRTINIDSWSVNTTFSVNLLHATQSSLSYIRHVVTNQLKGTSNDFVVTIFNVIISVDDVKDGVSLSAEDKPGDVSLTLPHQYTRTR